jgi:sterol desaturase/sphingolipid hydroxylase (fatty acid hydroxylase superfamily)
MWGLSMPAGWPALLDVAATVLAAALLVLLPLEVWRRWRTGRLTRAAVLEMLASASPVIPTILLNGVVLAFITALFAEAAALSPWRMPVNGWTTLAAVLLVDFLYYWDHRCAHRFRPYWAISHSVHHSSRQYDQTVGLRISFIDGFLSPWFYLPAVLVGFDPLLVLAAFGFILGYQQWIHTETIGALPGFDGWLNTPANHRVHHGVQAQYLDKNYGAVLMVWDRLFGTYQPEGEPVRYGITVPIGSSNPWQVHTIELTRMFRDLRRAPTAREFLRRLLLLPRA